jgi:hypothetical protein
LSDDTGPAAVPPLHEKESGTIDRALAAAVHPMNFLREILFFGVLTFFIIYWFLLTTNHTMKLSKSYEK